MTQELRRLAEAATQGRTHVGFHNRIGDPMRGSGWEKDLVPVTHVCAPDGRVMAFVTKIEDCNFYAAASPAAILSLLDRLEKAEKDAARLDWLDNYAHIATWVDNEPTKLVIDAASGDEFTGDTWRAAIDAAMEASK